MVTKGTTRPNTKITSTQLFAAVAIRHTRRRRRGRRGVTFQSGFYSLDFITSPCIGAVEAVAIGIGITGINVINILIIFYDNISNGISIIVCRGSEVLFSPPTPHPVTLPCADALLEFSLLLYFNTKLLIITYSIL